MSPKTKSPSRGRPQVTEITESQRRMLETIQAYILDRGHAPTIAELCEILGITEAPVHDSLTQLVRKGYLERQRYVHRGLKILRHPPPRHVDGLVTLPLLGQVAAGAPLFAEENVRGEALVPAAQVPKGNCFALKVKGDSMTGAGLKDGDTIVVRQQPLARTGEIVVALVDGEATIKRLHWEGDTIELRPENGRYKPISITRDTDLRIVGVMVAHSQQWC